MFENLTDIFTEEVEDYIFNKTIAQVINGEEAEAHAAKKARHALQRKNTQKHITRNKTKVCCKGYWYNHPDEDGVYRTWNNGIQKHKPQDHRYSKLSLYSKPNTYKKCYESPEVEKQKYFDKVDQKEEEHEAKRSSDFAVFLREQDAIDLKAGELLDEFEQLCLDNSLKISQLYHNSCIPFVDYNYPGVVYFVEPECIRAFRNHMIANGACIVNTPHFEDHWKIKHVVGVRTDDLVFEEV